VTYQHLCDLGGQIMDHLLCIKRLKEVMEEVRLVTASHQRKHCWAWKNTTGYEFHGPDGFHTFMSDERDSMIDCLYAAKAEGWKRWLHTKKKK
jgi:hypothetical protein